MWVDLFGNWDQRASPGITAGLGFADPDRKRPEAAQFDPLTACQRSDNFVEYGVDNFLSVLKAEVRALMPYAPNEIGLNHSKLLYIRDQSEMRGWIAGVDCNADFY
jgi:hypothetical protein